MGLAEPLEGIGKEENEIVGRELRRVKVDEDEKLLLFKLIGATNLRGIEELPRRELLERDEIVGRELGRVKIDEDEKLLLFKLIGATNLRGLEELPRRELLERDELEGSVVTELVDEERLVVGGVVEETGELELLGTELELDGIVEEEMLITILDELDEEVVGEEELVDDMLVEQDPRVNVKHLVVSGRLTMRFNTCGVHSTRRLIPLTHVGVGVIIGVLEVLVDETVDEHLPSLCDDSHKMVTLSLSLSSFVEV